MPAPLQISAAAMSSTASLQASSYAQSPSSSPLAPLHTYRCAGSVSLDVLLFLSPPLTSTDQYSIGMPAAAHDVHLEKCIA